jgi:hypothetical protein
MTLLDDDVSKHQKRAKKRPYKVEGRWFSVSPLGGIIRERNWYHWASYATEKSREQGLKQLRRSHPNMEFRAKK